MERWTPPTESELDEMRRADELARRMEEAKEAERRRSVRLALHANVTVTSESNFFAGFTENLSEGGVFVATMSPPGMGEEVALKITVNGEAVTCQGVVRWMRTDDSGSVTGCGIQFKDLSPDARKAVDKMFADLQREPLLAEL